MNTCVNIIYGMCCVCTDRSYTRGLILFFSFLFSHVSCLRYVCTTANSSLELNIQLIPLVSRDPRNELCGSSTSIRIHACTYFPRIFFTNRTLHSAVLVSSIIVNNARCLDVMHCRKPTSRLSIHYIIPSALGTPSANHIRCSFVRLTLFCQGNNLK